MMNRIEKSIFFCLTNYQMFDLFEKLKSLFEIKPSPLIVTKLLKHQKQRLYFMMNRIEESIFFCLINYRIFDSLEESKIYSK